MSDFGQSTPEKVGRWRILSTLGRGELAQVYEASDEGGGSIAIKLFAAHLINAQAALAAYETTARAAGALSFDVIVEAREIGTDPKLNRPYSIADKIALPTLEQVLTSGGPLPPERVARLFEAITPALDAAHLAAIVHRDLKPTNLFLSPEDPLVVRITDFGVSAMRIAAPPPPGWGATAGWHGPDAAEPSSPSTPAMDVYALGLVAFYALTGKSPFRALEHRPVDTHQLWNELIEPLGSAAVRARELGLGLPAELDGWFARALAPHPRSRFRSVGEMTKGLIDTVRTLADPRQPVSPLKPKSSPSQPRPASAPPPASIRPPADSDVHGAASPVHIPPGVAAAVVQPIAFMPSLPPPRRAAPAPVEAPAAPQRTAPTGTLVPILLVAILLAIGALTFAMWQRSAPSPERAVATEPSTANSAAVAAATATTEPSASAAPAATASAAPSASGVSPEPSGAASDTAAPEAAAPEGSSSTPPVGKAFVTFECSPSRCDSVFCDGKAVLDIFQPVPLRAGRHTCKALKQGYRSLSQTFTVHSGDAVSRTFPQEKRVETKSKYRAIKRL